MKIQDLEYLYIPEGDFVRKVPVNVPEFKPFWLSPMQLKDFTLPIKVIKLLDFDRKAICVRTDKVKFAWVWWLLVYRVDKTAEYFKTFVVLSLGEWGLAWTDYLEFAKWKDIGKKKPLSK